MYKGLRSIFLLLALGLVPAAASAQAGAQIYRIVVPIGAGTPFDVGARALAQSLHQVTGRNYIVENKPGAGSTIGTAEVARAKPDGTTLLYTTAGHATVAGLYSKLPYDPIKDFTPITMTSQSKGMVMLVRADSPFKSAQEVIDRARAKPGSMTYGSYGVGNTTHVVGALFAREAKLDLIHVPYKTSPLIDLMGGQIDVVFQGSSTAIAMIKEGKLRALATSNHERDPTLPGVPTFRELGVQGAEVPTWAGVLAPAGMPQAQVDALYKDIVAATRTATFQEWATTNDSTLVLMQPEDFTKNVHQAVARFTTLIPSLGIRLD